MKKIEIFSRQMCKNGINMKIFSKRSKSWFTNPERLYEFPAYKYTLLRESAMSYDSRNKFFVVIRAYLWIILFVS